jgi:hypothetical protein
VGKVTFGEFVSDGVPERALIYAAVPMSSENDQALVAVCLFGSLENYADFIIDAGTDRADTAAGPLLRRQMSCTFLQAKNLKI